MVGGIVDAHSTAYQVGEVTGIVFLVVLAVTVVRRALTRGFASITPAPVYPSWPPGDPAPLPAPAPSAPQRRQPRTLDIAIAVAAVAIAAVAVTFYVRGLTADDAGAAWDSQRGIAMRAGFLDGCNRSGAPADRCQCLFTRITHVDRYSTPEGFATLAPAVQRFQQTGDIGSIPPALVNAARGCA